MAQIITRCIALCLFTIATLTTATGTAVRGDEPVKQFRVGMIGLDTSHCLAFADLLNNSKDDPALAGCRVVLVYPKGSPDIESSVKRVPEYTTKIKEHGVEIIEDLNAMVEKVDAVMLETNDGRPHLEQVIPVLKARKPVFIDKPVAGSLTDAIAIYELAKHYNTPVFSSSSLRFAGAVQAVRAGSIGDVVGCDAFSPCSLEATHPDLFWYGIHGCETLFTAMGPGVQTVVRTSTKDFDQVTGTWKDGRIGTFRGIRSGSGGYGGTAFGTKGVASVGPYDGYKPLVVEIVKFYRTGTPPVTAEETLDIYAFMEAADESKRQGGKPVAVSDVMAKSKAEADAKVKKILEAK
ncbi:MAG: Gfo/Idh/MocA family oxidoreductase [Planctomycetaceae bacterium]|nr:Gfo/Idh/MocA family oxidoreductase [Planctomycetaceae bacterium]